MKNRESKKSMKDKFTDFKSKYDLRKAVGVSTVFMAVTGIVTGLIPNPVYIRMVPITFLDYFFLITTSVLAGLYFGKKECRVIDSRVSALGGLTGFAAFGCPVCNAVFLAFLSSSAIMTHIYPLRPLLGVISTLALGYLLYRS